MNEKNQQKREIANKSVKILQQDLGLNSELTEKLDLFLCNCNLDDYKKEKLVDIIRHIACDHVAGILFFEE